jgi:type III restriction enzyme
MALHKDFPKDKFALAPAKTRWFPAEEDLREKGGYEKLLPPLVAKVREEVEEWRARDYEGASETSRALLRWWFVEPHVRLATDGTAFPFQYYFAQREAVETIVWLYDVAKARSKYDLMRFDGMGRLSANMFPEDWLRMVVKMATGSGKTKVMSLIIAWAYFHKLYEPNSELARNFLLITPNVIVFERIKNDFEGHKIFYEDPILPDDGYAGKNWQEDFQVNIHFQDDVGHVSPTGNIFLTNIHRVYASDIDEASFEDEDTTDYFLGKKAVAKTNENMVDLGDIVRDIDEIIVINDEAHHIHDPKMAWFQSIEDIHRQLVLRGGGLSLQIDVTATPKDAKGYIFPQVVSDYPLVEAIFQDVVKKPVVPDQASRARLEEVESAKFIERYKQFIDLGVIEWKKAYEAYLPSNKKSLLFVMTTDTINCDDVAEYLEATYPELKGAVLTIHTNQKGEIAENMKGKNEKELQKLRKQSNEIDSNESPYKAIVSVLMLKEGWDVKNVTTIVGLRPYSAKSQILPEQTLGRGLRKMFFGQDVEEYVSVVGTPAFMEFVESIKAEGVTLEKRAMGKEKPLAGPEVIKVDRDNEKKDIAALDIELPVLTPRIQREYKDLNALNIEDIAYTPVSLRTFSDEEKKEIVFEDTISKDEHHKTVFDATQHIAYQNVLAYFVQVIRKELRLVSSGDAVLYEKVKAFVVEKLFGEHVDLEDTNVLRNLSETEAKKGIIEGFKKAINELTVQDVGGTEVQNYIRISEARPFVVSQNTYLIPKKSVFNKIVGDSGFELEFANWLESLGSEDFVSFAKNYLEIHFKIEYKTASGSIGNYYPDFFVKKDADTVYIIETKGREDLDDVEKVKRLAQWCADASERVAGKTYMALYVKQEDWERYRPKNFADLVQTCGVVAEG